MTQIQILELNDIAPLEWDALVEQSTSPHLLQSYAWGEFKQLMGQSVWRYGMLVDHALVIGAQVVVSTNRFGLKTAAIFHGPAALPAFTDQYFHFVEHLCNLLRMRRVGRILIEPGLGETTGEPDWARLKLRSTAATQPHSTLLMDLKQSPDELLNSYKTKTRYNVRLAEKKGVSVTFGDSLEDLQRFHALHLMTCRRQRIGTYPLNYFTTLRDAFLPGKAFAVAIASHEGEDLAGLICISGMHTAHYLFGGSSDLKRDLMPTHLLHHEAMLHAKKQGNNLYDFWGIALSGDPEEQGWAGITRFKLGFGGQPVTYPEAREQILSRTSYLLTSTAHRALLLLKRLRS